jgi:hypothetical protein
MGPGRFHVPDPRHGVKAPQTPTGSDKGKKKDKQNKKKKNTNKNIGENVKE